MRATFVEPMLPTLVDEPPGGDEWQHEIKYDGYRTQIAIENGEARAFTRRGHDWTNKYRPIVAAAIRLPCASALLDGEIIVQDEAGRSDFAALKAAIHRDPGRLVFMVFDLLSLDGHDLRSAPLQRRRADLEELLGENRPDSPIQFSAHVEGDGREFLAAVDSLGLEGIVSKKANSRYRSGRTKSWLKIKTFDEGEFVVIGTSKGDRAPVALLARENDGALEYAGGAMVTLAQPARDRFWEAIERIRVPEPPIPMEPRKETGWAKPVLRVRVRFLRGEDPLRHATVSELLEDAPQPKRSAARDKRSTEPPLPNPKIDPDALAAYYEHLGPILLRWAARRPLNLLRCSGRSCRFQRNETHPPVEPGTFGPAIGRLPILQKNGRTENYLFVDSMTGVRECVAADVVEFHGWGSSIGDVEKPDRLVIDIDPDEGLDFMAVREAAFIVRTAFESLDLQTFAMLTGGKGIHVVLPIRPRAEWPEVRAFAHGFCRTLAEAEPERFTIALPKVERRGRIFLDYLRNQRTATAVMPYSARARRGAPVAAPVTWSELEDADTAAQFSIADAGGLAKRARSKSLREWGAVHQVLPLI